ncbi:metallophosphoesterase family protein [Flexithrix dorotheae]|uniref:metallophosphoesterase family protein n=1 Tax=Flexithrix dorotheae TaxID=70993 RepID=UPI000364C7E0|nr:metallophosphoesterase family protein [Flexithrix dorotheae]
MNENDFNITHSIPLSKKRRLVTSDIHGCFHTFKALISKIGLTPEDQLFLLGDYVDRGPGSSRVIDYILKLMEDGYQVFPLRGNHEEIYIDFEGKNAPKFLGQYAEENYATDLLNSMGRVKSRYLKFMKSLPYFFELENCFLVHAGFDFSSASPFENIYQMVWIRNYFYDENLAKGKQIIYGHTPTAFSEIEEAIQNKKPLIPLDNGCVFGSDFRSTVYPDYGKLLCLNLDTFELISQYKID